MNHSHSNLPLNYEGIVVLGTPRSGTTLLRRILNAHPQIACPPETNLFVAGAKFLQSERIKDGLDIGVLSGLSFMGVPDDVVVERLREFVFGFLRDHAAQQGMALWAEKTAFTLFHLPLVEQLCGNRVRYLCISRHALDVAVSIQELCDKNGVYLSELHRYLQREPEPLAAFSQMWSDLTYQLVKLCERRPHDCVSLRYEDLIAEPQATAQRVFSELGLEYDPHLVEQALNDQSGKGLGDWKTYQRRELDATSVGRWKHLPATTVSRLAAIVNDVLVRCGYNPLPTTATHSAEEARRRYEIGLSLGQMTSKPRP